MHSVSVSQSSAVLTAELALLAAVASVQAAELLRSLFVCPARVHVSTDLTQSALVDCKLPAARLSPSQLCLRKFL